MGRRMNIQTTNTPPTQTTIDLPTSELPQITAGMLFQHQGRIWRAVQVTDLGVTAAWVPNAEVTRNELPISLLN